MNKIRRTIEVLFLLTWGCSTNGLAAENVPSVEIQSTEVVEKSVSATLLGYGVLIPDPDRTISLSLPSAGMIGRVWVRIGQRINQGDSLFEVITSPDDRMQYNQAQSAVDLATQELERKTTLRQEQLATQSELEIAKTNLADALATLEALSKRGSGIDREIMYAPLDGIVTQLHVSQGDRLPAETMTMLIADSSGLLASIGVEPEELNRLELGMPLTVSPVFENDIVINTTVMAIHGMVDPASSLVEVLATIPEVESSAQNHQVILGSPITASFQFPSHSALIVPRSAVLGEGTDSYLFLVEQGKARKIQVNKGLEDGDLLEVRGNLRAGNQVVVVGNYELKDGMAVREKSQ